MNLLKETIEALEEYRKKPSDVLWVGETEEYAISWDEFKEIANVLYDNGFGGQEIASDLLIVGEDFWLERHEYDGSECWEYKSYPKKPEKPKKIHRLHGEAWSTLKKLHNE